MTHYSDSTHKKVVRSIAKMEEPPRALQPNFAHTQPKSLARYIITI